MTDLLVLTAFTIGLITGWWARWIWYAWKTSESIQDEYEWRAE